MKKMVAGMMNALLALTSSLKAEVRSTRTHSLFSSTMLLSCSLPIDLALYCKVCIQSTVYTCTYKSLVGRPQVPGEERAPPCWRGPISRSVGLRRKAREPSVALCRLSALLHHGLYLHRAGLELGGSGAGVDGVDRELVDRRILGEVVPEEHETRAHLVGDTGLDVNSAAPGANLHHLPIVDTELAGVLFGNL